MKIYSIIATMTLVGIMALLSACNNQGNPSSENSQGTEFSLEGKNVVTIYYFHGDRRCVTCKAVGRVSKKTFEDHFKDNPNVEFRDINIDDPENNELKDRMEMSGSGLYIFNGKTKEDITAIAFQKAVDHPEELENMLIQTVNELM